MAVVASDSGSLNDALKAMDKEYAVAQKKNDVASMAADLQAKGNILAEMPRYDEAGKTFDQSLQMIEGSDLSKEIKDKCQTFTSLQPCRPGHRQERLCGGKNAC